MGGKFHVWTNDYEIIFSQNLVCEFAVRRPITSLAGLDLMTFMSFGDSHHAEIHGVKLLSLSEMILSRKIKYIFTLSYTDHHVSVGYRS